MTRGYAAGADDVAARRPPRRVRERAGARRRCKTNALYEGKYPLVSALSRPVIARGGRRARARARRRGGRPRLHRQGQRPAPLRARVQGELPGRARDRAAARPGLDARRGDRVRAGAAASRSRPSRARRSRSTRTCSAARSRPGMLEDPWEAPPEEAFPLTVDPDARAGAGRGRDRLRGRPPRLARRRGAAARRADRAAERAGRRLRDRADRHDREPRDRHQEPRALRGAGRDDADRRALGARGHRPDEGRADDQARDRGRWAKTRLRRALVLARCARRSTRSSTRRRSSSPARCGSQLRAGAGRRQRPALRARALRARRSRRTATGETFPHEAAEGFIRLASLEAELAAARERKVAV